MEQKDSKNILIIIADFYEEISSNLKNGATNYLNKIKYSYDIKFVPGTLNITSFNRAEFDIISPNPSISLSN